MDRKVGLRYRARTSITSPDVIDLEVRRRVRVRRKWLGVSHAALAEAVAVSFPQAQQYERAANRISASTLVRIAACLQTTVAELVGEAGEEGRPHPSSEFIETPATPGAVELVTAYAGVRSSKLRSAILDLALRFERA